MYICTSRAVLEGFCRAADLGHFILDLPQGKTQDQTSIWSASIAFHPPKSKSMRERDAQPQAQAQSSAAASTTTAAATPAQTQAPDPAAPQQTQIMAGGDAGRTMYYAGPIEYAVRKTGYYCVGASLLRFSFSSSFCCVC